MNIAYKYFRQILFTIFLIRYRRIMERSEERKARAKEEGREKMETTMKPFSFVVGE